MLINFIFKSVDGVYLALPYLRVTLSILMFKARRATDVSRKSVKGQRYW